jgi:hypothetical protein
MKNKCTFCKEVQRLKTVGIDNLGPMHKLKMMCKCGGSNEN